MPKLPGINHLDAVRALEKAGFRVARQGKHIVLTDGTRILTIPRHDPVNAFTMGGIVRDAGLTIEEFRKHLRCASSPRLKMGYKEHETVVLTRDLPKHSLRTGDLGTVVQVYSLDRFEVEFVRARGQTQALVTLARNDLRPVRGRDMIAVRQV